MSDKAPPSGKYQINLLTCFATRQHETGDPEDPYWTEQLRDRYKYRVTVVNMENNTMTAIESPEFGENVEQQHAAYSNLREFLADVITRNILPPDQCPQYRLDEDGFLAPV